MREGERIARPYAERGSKVVGKKESETADRVKGLRLGVVLEGIGETESQARAVAMRG